MQEIERNRVAIALIHHPVLGRKGETIGSAVTNLDLHDIARIARTYGIARYFVVTPYDDQQKLVAEILAHWQSGHGSTYNPARKEAFSVVEMAKSLDEAIAAMTNMFKRKPALVTTSANTQKSSVDYVQARHRINGGEPTLLVFGTAHGLAAEVTSRADYTLPAISGRTGYNHLSVRSAAAIICDRLLGEAIN